MAGGLSAGQNAPLSPVEQAVVDAWREALDAVGRYATRTVNGVTVKVRLAVDRSVATIRLIKDDTKTSIVPECPIDDLPLEFAALGISGASDTQVGKHIHFDVSAVQGTCANGHAWRMSGGLIMERTA